MEKLKNVMKGMTFLAGLIGILLVLSSVMKPKNDVFNANEVDQKVNALKKEEENMIDVIIIGDSETYSSYNSLQIWKDYGISSYICGTSAQRLCDTYSILKSSFELQSPKLVVLETHCLYRYAGTKQESEDKVLNLASKVFPVLQHHNRWKYPVMSTFFTSQEERNEEMLMKGFKYRDAILPYRGSAWMVPSDEREAFAELAEEYLMKIYELCQENGAELLLVTTPAPSNWSYPRHNAVNDWAMAHDMKYLDINEYCQELQLDWEKDTLDGGNHLNYSGAQKVTAFFGNYLKQEFELSDHRNEEQYLSWHESVEAAGFN